ncbi:unnamed protein product [Kuraishia capsulata CBS 1993]|uniref:Uncharacterized protein n=1 Tax=Kuraishia capsulata CBS 1993 TaxID=1382522 RepID=W6MND5_9ASCO|nr:uncharacterized protein KUCA_T00004112001 [Kuraishia capsulata CBS 1993]CDK28131.1 unnamed protein product [Kuraishia capsulata CBS 1993]
MRSLKYCRLAIEPHEGIGAIKLGNSLNQVIKYIKMQSWGTNVVFVYDEREINRVPITLSLPSVGLRFTFDPYFQKLFLIEATNWSGCEFLYQKVSINGDEAPTFQTIYNKHFGPAYPGHVEPDSDIYALSYPGIVFKFKLTAAALKKRTGTDEKFVQTLNGIGSSIDCTGFSIFKGASWREASALIASCLRMTGLQFLSSQANEHESSSAESMITWNTHAKVLKLICCEINLPIGIVSFSFSSHPDDVESFLLQLGKTTMQEMVGIFGLPGEVQDRTFDSKLNIHSLKATAGSGSDSRGVKKVHKYLRYGFDVIYDTSITFYGSPPVKKLVIHNNMVNSLEFMAYERLNWVMLGYDPENVDNCKKDIEATPSILSLKPYSHPSRAEHLWSKRWDEATRLLIHSSMIYGDFPSYFKPEDSSVNQPLFLDRRQYAINQALNEIQGTGISKTFSSGNFEVIDYDDNEDSVSSGQNSKEDVTHVQAAGDGASDDDAGSITVTDVPAVKKYTSKDRSKDWGSTRLYGFGRVVFEVLVDTDSVSSVTLF